MPPEPHGALDAMGGALGLAVSGGRTDLPPSQHDPARVRQLADEVLSADRYARREPPQWLQRVAEWLAERLEGLLGSVGFGGQVATWVAWLVLALLAAAIAVILWLSLRRGWRVGGGHRSSDSAVRLEPAAARVDWAAEAERHEAAGRWRDGLRCRYRVLVGELIGRRLVPDIAGRTAGEYAREVAASSPEAAPAFASSTELFEAVWYGGASAGPAERDRFVGLSDQVLAAATTVGEVGDRPALPRARPVPEREAAGA